MILVYKRTGWNKKDFNGQMEVNHNKQDVNKNRKKVGKVV